MHTKPTGSETRSDQVSDAGAAVSISLAGPADASAMAEVIRAAFAARGHLDPPPPALAETAESLRAALERGDAALAWSGERVIGVILLMPGAEAGIGQLQRVSVHPDHQGQGVAAALVGAVHGLAVERGYHACELFVRQEFPRLRQWWQRHGYRAAASSGATAADAEGRPGAVLRRRLPERVRVPDAPAMLALGARLAGVLSAGDLIILSGGLGAGKTTLTQGLGPALDVDGPVISPTFVLSRVHPSRSGGPALVHVDAYRLTSQEELIDLDLDSSLGEAVTVVEWGAGLAESLSADRLEIEIDREADERVVWVQPVGARWDDVDLADVLEPGRRHRAR